MLEVEPLTTEEQARLDENLRASKRKLNLKNIPERDRAQTPPYALLPLLPHIPKNYVIWEPASNEYGFLAQAIRVLRGNYVIESGLELDGRDFLTSPRLGDMMITNPPFSLKYEWLERAYDNRQPFALLLPFDTWASARAQALFQLNGVNVILFNRRINFHMPRLGWGDYDEEGNPVKTWNAKKQKWEHRKSSSDYAVAWFTWGLDIKQQVVYGNVPLASTLPDWMTRPKSKDEIFQGATSPEGRLAIRRATNPMEWPTYLR